MLLGGTFHSEAPRLCLPCWPSRDAANGCSASITCPHVSSSSPQAVEIREVVSYECLEDRHIIFNIHIWFRIRYRQILNPQDRQALRAKFFTGGIDVPNCSICNVAWISWREAYPHQTSSTNTSAWSGVSLECQTRQPSAKPMSSLCPLRQGDHTITTTFYVTPFQKL